MSHFYGIISNGGQHVSTRCGHKSHGLHTRAKSWNGPIDVVLSYDEQLGKDKFTVTLVDRNGNIHPLAIGYFE